MHLSSQSAFRKQTYIILERLRPPKRVMRLHALPSNQPHIRLSLLPFILHVLNHPPSCPGLEPLRVIRTRFDHLIPLSFEPVVHLFEINRQNFGDGRRGADGRGRRVRGQVCVIHGEGPVDDGHEVLGEGAVGGGLPEAFVVVQRVPVWCGLRGVSCGFGIVERAGGCESVGLMELPTKS